MGAGNLRSEGRTSGAQGACSSEGKTGGCGVGSEDRQGAWGNDGGFPVVTGGESPRLLSPAKQEGRSRRRTLLQQGWRILTTEHKIALFVQHHHYPSRTENEMQLPSQGERSRANHQRQGGPGPLLWVRWNAALRPSCPLSPLPSLLVAGSDPNHRLPWSPGALPTGRASKGAPRLRYRDAPG